MILVTDPDNCRSDRSTRAIGAVVEARARAERPSSDQISPRTVNTTLTTKVQQQEKKSDTQHAKSNDKLIDTSRRYRGFPLIVTLVVPLD